jgi:DNA mismatch repair protein MutS2
MGVPGESHALDIAKRNGIPEEIVQKACSYIETKQADVSSLIKGLTEKYKELSELEKTFKSKEHTVNEKWRKVDLKELRLKQKSLELQEHGYKQSKDFLDESRKMLENLVRELREGEITREKTLKVKETIANLSKAVELENQKLLESQTEVENLESLQEQKEAMQDYYGEVMDMAIEEIQLYTNEMEELNSVLDHYSNILEIVGK